MTNPDFVAARRAALAAAHWQCPTCASYYPIGATCGVCAQIAHKQLCPHCGQPMIASTPASDPAPDLKAKTWRDREAML